MRNFVALGLFAGLIISICISCGNKNQETEAVADPAPKPEESAEAKEAADPSASAPAAQPNPAEALKSVGEALKAAGDAKGDTPCEQAYNGMLAMVESMSKALGDAAKDKGKMPEKDKFMEACAKLPEEVQKCMTMSYAMQHAQECEKVTSSLDPKVKAEMEQLMGK